MFLEKFKQIASKTDEGNNKKKIENLFFFLIILIIVLVAINLIWKDNKEENVQSTDSNKKLAIQQETNNELDNQNTLITQLEDILQNINGVGKVKVLVTYSQTSQTIPLYNEESTQKDTQEEDNTGGTRKVVETDIKKEVIYQESNGTKNPITQSTISPKVEGAIITAQGATNSSVKTNIIQAVEAVTGLATHKIQVFAMSEN